MCSFRTPGPTDLSLDAPLFLIKVGERRGFCIFGAICESSRLNQHATDAFYAEIRIQGVRLSLHSYSRIFHNIYLVYGNVSGGNHKLRENSCKPRQKNRLNSPRKITHVDDVMIHNIVKYLVQTRLFL